MNSAKFDAANGAISVQAIPRIDPVLVGVPRPQWSVMIPTFNCAHLLRQTLASVLAQAPGPDAMQIEVVDDGSTKDDPGAVVQEVGKGRVEFHRNSQNQGATANFNTCVQRSRGQLVHILHGDDYVLPGFYDRIAAVAEEHPGMALFASRSFVVDEENVILAVTERISELESGGNLVDSFFYATPIQTPGIIVRRNFYERHGGFLLNLVHTADCEMWARAVSIDGGVVTSEVLACYRHFQTNDTGRLARTGENLRDIQRLNEFFAKRHATFDMQRARRRVCDLALVQAERFTRSGDNEAAHANLDFWRRNATIRWRLRRWAGRLGRSVLG